MVKKRKKENKIHGLVLLKTETVQKKSIPERTYKVEDVDQENKIKLYFNLVPSGSLYRYSILLINESLAPIVEVKIKVKIPNFLELKRYSPTNIDISFPSSDERGFSLINMEIDELNEKSRTQLNLYFTPDSLDKKGPIITVITYVNNKDFVRVINSEPIEIIINPLNVQPKIIASTEISNFLKMEGIKKVIKSLGIANVIESDTTRNLLFNHVNLILQQHEFQLIAIDNEKRVAWYYGTDLESRKDILVIGQIISNKVEFLAASQNHQILIPLLIILSKEFKNHIMNIGDIISSVDQIYDVECKFCGTVFPYFPKKGVSIECKNCHKEQVLW